MPGQKQKIFLAGPCSVESEEQIFNIAEKLKNSPLNWLRGGIWKPRTRPGSFEGIGEVGLKWLVEAAKSINKPAAVEVATPVHIELALKAGIDALWIGARTTVNPFSVQELADALEGVDVPVMVKNPVNPDLGLWIGAVERLKKRGVNKIYAIHRGFSVSGKSKFRNPPMWSIPLDFKRECPDIPLICDPSHICGNRVMLHNISQEAMDLLFDGLMIEVHNNPTSALSDANQQITPEEYNLLISSLNFPVSSTDDEEFYRHIEFLRKEIDDIDNHLIHLLARRFDIAEEIGEYKKKKNVASFQPHRWEDVISSRINMGKLRGIDKDFIIKIYRVIHEESIMRQEKDLEEIDRE